METVPVALAPFNLEWGRDFNQEADSISEAIGTTARCFVEHVGSTAIRGLDAKPVVDILVEIRDWRKRGDAENKLVLLGYGLEERLESGLSSRSFLTKRVSGKSVEGFNVHLVPAESEWGRRMLVFRDELLSDADLRSSYCALKRRLQSQHTSDLDAYTSGKSEFVERVLVDARSFSVNRLLAHQRAELDRSQTLQIWVLMLQFGIAVLAGISVLVASNSELLNLAAAGFLLTCGWTWLARKQRAHRSAGDEARRVVLLSSGLGHRISAEQRMRILDGFKARLGSRKAIREESYFSTRAEPSSQRLAEMIQESAYWTRDLQRTSGSILCIVIILAVLLVAAAAWLLVPTLPSDGQVGLARIFIALLIFLISSDVIGAMFGHLEAAAAIAEILQRIESSSGRGHPAADVFQLMADYNAVVENAPGTLPGAYQLRRGALTSKWRAYLENKGPTAED